jgi:hypothetical protein
MKRFGTTLIPVVDGDVVLGGAELPKLHDIYNKMGR